MKKKFIPKEESILNTIKYYGTILGHSLIHLIFLGLWFISQILVQKFIYSIYKLEGIEDIEFTVFKILLALTTLLPIMMRIIKYIRVLLILSNKEIEDIKEKH